MKPFRPLSSCGQLVEHIRQAIVSGKFSGEMPGIRKLAQRLGVSSNTVGAAISQLEKEGFLEVRGQGRSSRIILPENYARPSFRVTLLLYERADLQLAYVGEIQRQLREQGHDVNLAPKSLTELGMKVERVARMVQSSKTDAWVILSATKEVLEWFVAHDVPAFALSGRFRELPIAGTGPNKVAALRKAVRRLAEFGHRRIVLLQPDHMRKPDPGLLLREALEEIESHGIKTGPYNLPDWEQSPEGLRRCLDSLFSLSPPTALILDRPCEYIAAQHYLARKGVLTPRDISLVCTDDDGVFEWCRPPASSIRWDSQPWVRRIVGWVNHVAHGKDDRRHSFSKAVFVERGSIGPARTAPNPIAARSTSATSG